MLLTITEYKDLDKRKLMDIYSESNYETTDFFYPDEADKDVAVQKVEAGFLDFLKNDYFRAGWSCLLDPGEKWRMDQCFKTQQDPNGSVLS